MVVKDMALRRMNISVLLGCACVTRLTIVGCVGVRRLSLGTSSLLG